MLIGVALVYAPGPVFAASPEVRVTKTVSGGFPAGNTFAPGSNITYTITIQNLGPDTATNLHVQDVLPPELTVVTLSSVTSAPKPVAPQIFQNPGAIAIVSQRPPKTPTPTPVAIR